MKEWVYKFFTINGTLPKTPRPKLPDIWVLTIRFNRESNLSVRQLTNTDYRELYKIYSWFLTRDSEKYNITHKFGTYVILRKYVTEMNLVIDKK